MMKLIFFQFGIQFEHDISDWLKTVGPPWAPHICDSRARQREQEAELEKAGMEFLGFLDWKGGHK